MQLKNPKHLHIALLLLVPLLASHFGCSSETQKYEILNDFLGEYEQLFNNTDSLALFQEGKIIRWDDSIFPVDTGTFSGGIGDDFYIPEELKNGQTDKEFMDHFITQKDITAWNKALQNIHDKTFTWDSSKINKHPVLNKPPYYLEENFIPVEIPEGGYPIDKILRVSEPVFNDKGDKALLDAAILYAPLNVVQILFLLHKTNHNRWEILYLLRHGTS